MGKKLSMQQLADRLGVSKYTVSQALSGKPGVSEATRREVIALAGALGYTIKPTARTGKRKAGAAAALTEEPGHAAEKGRISETRYADGAKREAETRQSIEAVQTAETKHAAGEKQAGETGGTAETGQAPQTGKPMQTAAEASSLQNRQTERTLQRQVTLAGKPESLPAGSGEQPAVFIGLDENHLQEPSFWLRVREGIAAGCRLQGLRPHFFTYGPEGAIAPELAAMAFPDAAASSTDAAAVAAAAPPAWLVAGQPAAAAASAEETATAAAIPPAERATPAPADPAPSPAGFIIAGNCPLGLLLRLKRSGLPIVLADHEEPLIGADAVLNANAEAGRMACRHLLSQGCRRIAFIGRDSFAVSFRERWWGCRQALDDVKEPGGARHGGSSGTRPAQPVQLKKWTVPYGSAALHVCQSVIERKLDASLEELPDGFVCANDDLALCLLNALRRRKPDASVRVVGIDNTAAGMNAALPLTTVDLAKETLGIRAVEAFARKLRQPEAQPEKIILSARLIVRHSG